jgi:hypothetical protein
MGEVERLPSVAPFDSCIACFKGDVKPAITFEGSFELVVAGLLVLGLPNDQAEAVVFHGLKRQGINADENGVPDGDLRMTFVCCSDCAAPTFPVGPVDGLIPTVRAPSGWEGAA